MAKNTRGADLAQVKKSLSILRKKGLYKPERPRAKPTKYGLSLLRKYSDVAAGKSYVVKADKAALQKLATEYRVTRGRVVIPSQGTNIKPTVTKSGEVRRRMSIGGKKFKFRPARMGDNGKIEAIGPHQSYSVPIREGKRLRFQAVATQEELYELAAQFEMSSGGQFDILKYTQIVEPEGGDKYRVYFTKDGTRKKRIVYAPSEETVTAIFRDKFPEFWDWIITRIEPA